jgi:23S rRNA (adenine2503-C2)-methyltransferase
VDNNALNIEKTALCGLKASEIAALLPNESAYRARQIADFLRAGVSTFNEMTSLPLELRSKLEDSFLARSTFVEQVFDGKDGTKKAQIRLIDGLFIESVLLGDGAGRATACISTQAGCAMGCVFCKTGSLGFKRNLGASEIVEQFYHLSSLCLSSLCRDKYPVKISNIVIMGMGEPLLNLDELRKALLILGDSFSMRRVTISTCGITGGIRSLAENGPAARLAVSINSCEQELRDKLMPGCAVMPLGVLKKELLYYQSVYGQRITLETVLFAGLNTGKTAADALAEFAEGLSVLVNLIPWNQTSGFCLDARPLVTPDSKETLNFKTMLEKRGIKTYIRRKKGSDVSGACGQLGV